MPTTKYEEYLILNGQARDSRSALPQSFGKSLHFPSGRKQGGRLGGSFTALQSHFKLPKNGAKIAVGPEGAMPEQVIVLEIIDDVADFIKAAQKIEGLDLQLELDADGIDADENFYQIIEDGSGEDQDHRLRTKMFLVLTNQEAMRKILKMWNQWKRTPGKKFEHGLGKWKELFKRLYAVRLWSDQDRLEETGILEYWKEQIEANRNLIFSEVELWYSPDAARRDSFVASLAEALTLMGGEVVSSTVIPEIRYHGLIVKTPANQVRNFINRNLGNLTEKAAIMFFRPCAQAVISSEGPGARVVPFTPPQRPIKNERCLILDGYPLENHNYLKSWINVNDLFNFGGMCPPADRKHGTAVSSLVVHGDNFNLLNPTPYKIVVTPILKPEPAGQNAQVELLPENLNIIDLVHRAVVENLRQFPNIKVINFSIGITGRPFNQIISPLARLIDWLSWKYKVTFVISAGNCADDILIDSASWAGLSTTQRKDHIIKNVINDLRNRKILSPAESFSGLTVGALHSDNHNPNPAPPHVDPAHFDHISPISRFGAGIKRAIKPEIYFPGGRQLMRDPIAGQNNLRITQYNAPPGILTAAPGPGGSLTGTSYQRGTSFAAAICTHNALRVIDFLDQQRTTGKTIPVDFDHLLVKALLVNSADTVDFMAKTKSFVNGMNLNQWAAAELNFALSGYGKAQPDKTLGSTDFKVTAIAVGEVLHEKSVEYRFPIPDTLGGKRALRRVTTTLVWSSAINPNSQKYRASALFSEVVGTNTLGCQRGGVYEKATRRGSVEHSVYQGDNATSFQKGSDLVITVNCREDGMKYTDPVPFALVVTMETEERDELKIFQEIKTRIQTQVRATVTR